ncbi:hypothetical protein [Myceligenerans halotolerans]
MTNTQEIRTIIGKLAADDGRSRGLAADSIVDWPDAIDAGAGGVLSRLLEVAILIEDSDEALEGELHALAELAERNLVPGDVLARVSASREWSQMWAGEYIEFLREQAGGAGA